MAFSHVRDDASASKQAINQNQADVIVDLIWQDSRLTLIKQSNIL